MILSGRPGRRRHVIRISTAREPKPAKCSGTIIARASSRFPKSPLPKRDRVRGQSMNLAVSPVVSASRPRPTTPRSAWFVPSGSIRTSIPQYPAGRPTVTTNTNQVGRPARQRESAARAAISAATSTRRRFLDLRVSRFMTVLAAARAQAAPIANRPPRPPSSHADPSSILSVA